MTSCRSAETAPPRPPQWNALLPGTDFRWQMSLRPGDGGHFFTPTPDTDLFLEERRRWLMTHPREFVAALPESFALVEEAVAMISRWLGENRRPAACSDVTEAEALCFAGGIKWEPDWVLLRPDEAGTFRLVAGVVCFPSMWSLREKLGGTIAEIHNPVAGLNANLGAKIDTFLARVKAGQDWERENWGLSANNDLNHHPRFRPAGLTGDSRVDGVWIRLEWQLFSRLPETSGLLFGIRVLHYPLADIASQPGIAHRLAQALTSMPNDVADYKGLSAARENLIRELERL
ncbi:MAG: heme-dependent oxidative N-demethylase subunit alpha family protein [Verrucomicrobiales bacterium]